MALTKKNIIVGAARVYLGPSVDEQAGADIDTRISTSKPAYQTGVRYSDTLNAAGSGGADPALGTDSDNWNEVGYTQDGLEVATDPSWGEVEVDQLLDSAKIFKDGMSLNISTTFAEATLENLLIAWGQASTSLSTTGDGKEVNIEGGALGEAPLERGFIAIGNAPEKAGVNEYGERVYQAYRVLSVEATTITNSRSEASTIPVTLRALPADNGRYGTVRDRLMS